MMWIRNRTRRFASVAALVVCAVAAPAAIAADPTPPELTVPKVDEAPTIDGKLDDPQWQRAAVIGGFIAPTGPNSGTLTPSRAKILLAHDGERYLLAIDCDLPPGVKPSMNYRRRDSKVYMDRYQLEAWLTPPDYGSTTTAYQMIANAYGAIYDAKHVPQLGVVSSTWNGNWEVESTYETGARWTVEIAVPFEDLMVRKDVKAWDPEQTWGGMVAVAWPQRGWPYTGGWYKNIQTHARLTMSREGSAVRVEDLNSLLNNQLAVKMTLVNGKSAAQTFTVRGQVKDQVYEQEVVVPANGSKPITLSGKLPPMPEGDRAKQTLSLRVTDEAGETLLRGDWPYREQEGDGPGEQEAVEPKPWEMTSRVAYAPDAKGLEAWTDLLDYPKRDEVEAVKFTVRPKGGGGVVAESVDRQFEYDGADARFWLPDDLAIGEYDVEIAILSKEGAILDSQMRDFKVTDLQEQFHWYGSDIAEDIEVAPPFTPIKASGKTLGVWGRDYRMDGGFPTQITSQDAELLAAPIQLVAVVDGEAHAARSVEPFELQDNDGTEATFTAAYEVAGHRVTLSGRLAFDGMLHYDMSVEPGGDAATLDGLYLSMPLRSAVARYFYTSGGGWSGSFGYVPDEASDEPFWTTQGFADFVPYIGLTDDHRALQWFADNAHDWVLGDQPMVTLHRSSDAVEARVHLVQKPAKLTDPLEAQFGFIASPVKPMPSGWRHSSLNNSNRMNAKTSLFFGAGHGGCYIDPHDSAKLAKALGIEIEKGQDPDAVFAKLPPQRDSIDWEQVKKSGAVRDPEKAKNAAEVMTDPSAVHHTYFFNAKMYFEGNRSRSFRTFFKGDWVLDPPSGWFHLTPTESYRDFFTFHMDKWAKHWVMPGLYFDEVYLAPDYNVMNGNGKPMPDGSVRPSIPLMKQRKFMQRMWRVQQINDLEPFIWVHTSNYMAPHAISPVNVALFGEDKGPTNITDYVDEVPSILMRTIGRSQKFGFIPIWMDQAGRGGDLDGSRLMWGWCWQHDVVPEYHTSHHMHAPLAVRVKWGIAEDDVRYTPFWDNEVITPSDDDVIVSHWTQPGSKVLIQVMNLNREQTEATLTLDVDALKLPKGAKIYDLESHPPVVKVAEMTRQRVKLRAQGENDRKLMYEARDVINDTERLMDYSLDELETVGSGDTLTVTLPARDFRMFIVE